MTFRESIDALRLAQKSSSGAPAYSRFINRPIGRVFAAMAFNLNLTPNQVTVASAACTLSAIATIALVSPTFASSMVVVALLVIGYALDSADGQLARLRGGGSARGEWLDHVVDAIKMSSIHGAVLICWARFYAIEQVWLLVPIGFGLVANVFFFGVILTDLIRRTVGVAQATKSERTQRARMSPAYALAVLPADYGVLMLSFLFLSAPGIFIGVYTVLFLLNAVFLVLSLVRWYGSLPKGPALA